MRTPAELAAAAAVKRALDPTGMLNPGVLERRLTLDQVPKSKPRSGAVSSGR